MEKSEAPNPDGGLGAVRQADDQENREPLIFSRPRQQRQHRCRACGTIGRLPLADPDPADQRPVLRVDFSAGCRLLCPRCRA